MTFSDTVKMCFLYDIAYSTRQKSYWCEQSIDVLMYLWLRKCDTYMFNNTKLKLRGRYESSFMFWPEKIQKIVPFDGAWNLF